VKSPLLRLWGIGKEVFQSLGGGEAFIRSEREQWGLEKIREPNLLDTMLFVYLIEAHPKHGVRAKEMLATMERRRDTLCTSVFTVGEVLTDLTTGRIRSGSASPEVVRPPAVELLRSPLRRRALCANSRRHRVSPPDAIHLASAAHAGVDLF